MDSESPPADHSPTAKGDNEVLSQRSFPGQVEVQEAARVSPEGEASAARHMGEQTPMATGDKGFAQFGPQPNTSLGTYTTPEFGGQPPSKEGHVPIPSVTSVQQRHRIICWKRYEALPLWMNIVSLWVW